MKPSQGSRRLTLAAAAAGHPIQDFSGRAKGLILVAADGMQAAVLTESLDT